MKKPIKLRRWPIAILTSVLVIAVAGLVSSSLSPEINLQTKNLPPGQGHWLGTDALGRDLLFSLVTGASRSLFISLLAGLAASAIGTFIGSISAYFGDGRWKVPLAGLAVFLIGGLLLVYGALVLWPVAILQESGWIAFSATFAAGIACYPAYICLKRLPFLKRRVAVPLDRAIQRFTEVFTVIPQLYLVVVFAMLIPMNVISLGILLTISSWVGISRLVRAEMIRVRSMSYIESARIMGMSEWRIFIRHALPNALEPVATHTCFVMANLLIAESTLSFIGIGISPEVVSWGSIINGFIENTSAWWLAFFPALLIYLLVLSYHAIGKDIDKLLHPAGD